MALGWQDMNEPIRHHFIPQMLLRNFADKEGQLHCFSKATGKIFSSGPEGVFARNHLHTQRDAYGNKDVSVEHELAKEIEGPATPVVQKIIEKARIGRPPGLTGSEKKTWDAFFCSLLRRLPAMRESLSDAELVRQGLDQFEQYVRPLTSSERKEYETPDLQRELTHNAWVQTLSHPKGELMDVIRSKGLFVGVIGNLQKSFVVGDIPTLRYAPKGRTDLIFPEVELLLPVSHDVMVTPAFLAGHEELVILPDTEWIREKNEAIFEQSKLVAAKSQRLIKSLSRVWSDRHKGNRKVYTLNRRGKVPQ